MTVNISKIGAGMLAAGTVFLNFASQRVAWWAGIVFMVAGPILMGLDTKHVHLKKRKK